MSFRPSKKLKAAAPEGLTSGLVSGKFPLPLFTGGYLNYEDVFSLRLVSKDFHSLITSPTFRDSLPDWSRIANFLRRERTPPSPPSPSSSSQSSSSSSSSLPPHPSSLASFAKLSQYNQAVALIKYQKLCVNNILKHFEETYNPLGWMSDYMGWEAGETEDPWVKLERSDPARYNVAIGVVNLAIAEADLAQKCKWGGWWDNIIAGDDHPECFDGMCGTSYRDETARFQGFFATRWSESIYDPKDIDVSDAKIISMATGELISGSHEQLMAEGPSESYERVLGSQHGVECDVFGVWKKDPEGELKRALQLFGK